MAQGKRTDSETKAKIIEAKINNPDVSTRDIERETGVPHETVAKVIREDFTQVCTQSSKVAGIIDRNDNLHSVADELINEIMSKRKETVRISELVSVRDSAFKQNQLLSGESTDNSTVTIKWE